MALINIYIGADYPTDNSIKTKLDQIMATIQDLLNKVDALQADLDTEQELILQAISSLQSTVAQLQELVTEGGTPEQRQALSDKLDAIIADLQSTLPDSATTTSSTTADTTTEAPVV